MRKLFFLIVMGLIAGSLEAGQVPPTITYQGTLRQSGVPFDGNVTMQFRITDNTGNPQYWKSAAMTINVKQGLFTAFLTPDTVDWQNQTPYIQVLIGNPPQTLGPPEPLSATAYALMSQSVIDGAITRQKVDATSFEAPGPGLVPAGAIMMFDKACPSGWTPYAALNSGRFPRGSATFNNTTGGNLTHTHSTPDHSHILATSDFRGGNPAGPVGIIGGASTTQGGLVNFSNGAAVTARVMQNYTETSGAGVTGAGDSLPPYLEVVYCQKS